MCESQRAEAKSEEERGDLHGWWEEGAVGVMTRRLSISLVLKQPSALLWSTWRVSTGWPNERDEIEIAADRLPIIFPCEF